MGKEGMEKEGLQSAIDFTKLLLTLAGGAVAFVLPTALGESVAQKVMSVISLACFAVCVTSGLVVFSRGCVMLANKNYNLRDSLIRPAGLTNVFSFGAGFGFLAIVAVIRIFS